MDPTSDPPEEYKGYVIRNTRLGYTILKDGQTIHTAEHIAAPLTNYQCAKLWIDDRNA